MVKFQMAYWMSTLSFNQNIFEISNGQQFYHGPNMTAFPFFDAKQQKRYCETGNR